MQAMIEATKVPNLPHNDPVKARRLSVQARMARNT